MKFEIHSELQGSHAFLSPSQNSWLNYSDEKLDATFMNRIAAARGTELHEFAAQAIKLGIKLQASGATLNKYVNDCVGFGMIPEQVLYYSPNCFGTADAIKFIPAGRNRKRPKLLVFDLKTGATRVTFTQLFVYCALFCLEYGFKPTELDFELRIYQNDDVQYEEPDVEDILRIMDKIVSSDRRIEELKAEVL